MRVVHWYPNFLAGGGVANSVLALAVARRGLYRKVRGFHVLSPAEQADVATALPTARTYCVPQGPSPAVQEALGDLNEPGNGRSGPVRLMFIGRIDVHVKGLDVLV